MKKAFPTVKFIDLLMNKSLNPSLIEIRLPMIKVFMKKQPLRGNVGYYYKCSMLALIPLDVGTAWNGLLSNVCDGIIIGSLSKL